MVTSNMVADLPATVSTAKAGAKSSGKTQLRKDNQHVRDRQTLLELIGQFESYRARFIREKEEVLQTVHDKLAAGIAALEEHDKKHANDNSIKNIAELTAIFADVDAKVKEVEARILEGVVNLQHEIAPREQQLEKLVAEQNAFLEKRRSARARCNGLTLRKEDSPHIDMAAVAEIIKDRHIDGIDAGMLKAIAASDPVDSEGFVTQKENPAKNNGGPPTKTVSLSKGFASYREMEIFAATTDDDPVGGPVEADTLGTVKRWFERCATTIDDGDEIKRKWEIARASRVMVDHKNLPSNIEQMRKEALKKDKSGKAAKTEILTEDKRNLPKEDASLPSPPHSHGEGVTSSSSQAGPRATTKEEVSSRTAATGNSGNSGKATRRKEPVANRRKTTSAPPSRGRKIAAPDDEIPRTESIVAAWGWTDGNKALFQEWKTYYGKLVLRSNVITEEDADTLL